jgi:hypothetical protein
MKARWQAEKTAPCGVHRATKEEIEQLRTERSRRRGPGI